MDLPAKRGWLPPLRSTGPALEAGGGAVEEPGPRSRRPTLGALLQARVSIDLGIHKLDIDGDEDRISALPDDVLLEILERLDDMREAVRAGALSTRWRHLPHRLSHLVLDIMHFGLGTSTSRADLGGSSSAVEAMQAYTRALYRSLSPCPPPAGCKRAIKTLILRFLPVTDLTSIGHAVEDVVSHGETEFLGFYIYSPDRYGREGIMSFSTTCPVAFRWLTKLTFLNLSLVNSDINKLITDCGRLRILTLLSCHFPGFELKIDAPFSGLHELYCVNFYWASVELIDVPKLTEVWYQESEGHGIPLVRFGHVLQLRHVSLLCRATDSGRRLALSEYLPGTARNFSELHLHFACQMIWIHMEHPKQLTATFRNLTNVRKMAAEAELH
ncbi:uncharacterized protein LOC125524651 isoform X1 [Triticum urartu]|uniref:uncharacterized protein LOC125524594 isoform X1 n=1 Tax=Triticum urartu TaxID=4572 RepID=UPI0020444AAD|nr:uncharacterized protein LOC125524594 isoform X1 [Triticum urartu]XP_048545638.1 uncharacterized protein LOC125524651 isoform X1 [Triticum urartu]